MDYYAGIDVSLEASSICVVDGAGKIAREAKIASEPAALIGWFGSICEGFRMPALHGHRASRRDGAGIQKPSQKRTFAHAGRLDLKVRLGYKPGPAGIDFLE